MPSFTLGDLTLNGFEIPEHFEFGGKQHIVMHSLPGGGRVVDAMGAEDAPIRWSGVFSGQQASDRVRIIDSLWRGGTPQIFACGAWRYNVIVERFEAQVTNSCWIPYQIQLCVLSSELNTNVDWLSYANSPTLAVELLSAAASNTAIEIASTMLSSNNISTSITSAGTLAQYVTARAYKLFAS